MSFASTSSTFQSGYVFEINQKPHSPTEKKVISRDRIAAGQPNGFSWSKIGSTALMAATLAVILTNAPDKTYKTKSSFTPLIEPKYIKTEEYYTFTDREKVMEYIAEKPGLGDFLKRLPSLITAIAGGTKTNLEVYRSVEEQWETLKVEIITNRPLEELTELEDKLFESIFSDASFEPVLPYVSLALV